MKSIPHGISGSIVFGGCLLQELPHPAKLTKKRALPKPKGGRGAGFSHRGSWRSDDLEVSEGAKIRRYTWQ